MGADQSYNNSQYQFPNQNLYYYNFQPKPYVRPTQFMPNQLNQSDYQQLSYVSGLSLDQINNIFVQFYQNNPDGVLNRQEFVDLYLKFAPNESFSNVNNIAGYVFDLFDKDHNGSISLYEFILSFNLIGVSGVRPDPTRKIEYLFDMYDNNKNGQLDIYELFNAVYGILSLTGAQQVYGDINKLVFDCLGDMDKDRTGTLSKYEFQQGVLNNNMLRSLLEKPAFM